MGPGRAGPRYMGYLIPRTERNGTARRGAGRLAPPKNLLIIVNDVDLSACLSHRYKLALLAFRRATLATLRG